MTEARASRPRSTPALSARLRSWSRRVVRRSRLPLVGLCVVTLALGVGIWFVPDYVPLMSLLVPLVVGSLVLGPRHLPWFVILVMLVLASMLPRQPDITPRVAISVFIMFAIGFLILISSFRRSSLGVAGVQGESMLVDLRDRILRQAGIPELPARWYAGSEIRSAGGTPFAGDFVVACRKGDRFDVAVVDVSGKGEGAATRALLLSGAMGGLLGAVPAEEFLGAANDFLLRQEWEEGFATAVHLSLDLVTGRFDLRSAGHPPAALREAGSGRWRVVEAEGPLLGLIPGAEYEAVGGQMRPGDALMLYTDGMVETPTRDISLGIDKMLGQTEQLLRGDFDGGAKRLVEAIGARNDDRALLLVHLHQH